MKAYPAYKDSGSAVLRQIPRAWNAKRLGHVAAVEVSNVDKHVVAGESRVRLCNYVDVYKNDVVTADLPFMEATATPVQIIRFRLRPGDTAFTKDSETADDLGVPAFIETDDLICGYHLAIARPDKRLAHPKFIFYVLKSQSTAVQWSLVASGVTRVGLRSAEIPKLAIAVPSLLEQRVIADYLDRETAGIDELIAEQEALVMSLVARRSAGADEAMGHRVGVGERLKWCLAEIDERAGQSRAELPMLSVSISWGVRRRSEVTDDLPRADDLSAYKVAQPGDVVINRMRAFQGALGVAPIEGLVSPDYAVLRVTALDSSWLVILMKSTNFVAMMSSLIRGIGGVESGAVRTPRISVADIGGIRVDVPALDEQRRIVQQLDEQISKLDDLTAECRELITLLKERRSALITAAVTGKIDVRNSV